MFPRRVYCSQYVHDNTHFIAHRSVLCESFRDLSCQNQIISKSDMQNVCVCVCMGMCKIQPEREREGGRGKGKDRGVEEGKGRDKPCHDPQLSGEAAQDLVLFMQLPKAPRRSRQWNRRIHPNSTPSQVTKTHLKVLNDETTFCIWKDSFTLFVSLCRTGGEFRSSQYPLAFQNLLRCHSNSQAVTFH